MLINITGKVQGVFFRAHAKEQAEKLSLKGYASNMPDGSVEILVQGEDEAVKEFLNWCRQGSPASKVESVEVRPSPEQKAFSSFEVF
ncbi:acylphosphatase [Candidatus Peregrinibacteria bacterium]|nr:acylphosphatase [Candidatus Peregrinibacteria bacterium]